MYPGVASPRDYVFDVGSGFSDGDGVCVGGNTPTHDHSLPSQGRLHCAYPYRDRGQSSSLGVNAKMSRVNGRGVFRD